MNVSSVWQNPTPVQGIRLLRPQIVWFTWPIWGPPGSCRSQVAPCWSHEPCYQGQSWQCIPRNAIKNGELLCFVVVRYEPIPLPSKVRHGWVITSHICRWISSPFYVLNPILEHLISFGERDSDWRVIMCEPGPHLNIKTVFPRYGDFHVKDKTAARPSYL